MSTTKAYDDLVERLRSGGSSKSQARRVATQMGERDPKVELIAIKMTVTTNSTATLGPKKRGWPKGKPRKPKAAK